MSAAPESSFTDLAALRQLIDEIEGSGGLYRMHENPDMQGRQLGIKKTAIVVAALRSAAQGQSERGEIGQHIGWLKQYIQGMTADNWQDMRLRAERQLDQLSQGISDPAYTAPDLAHVIETCAQIAENFPAQLYTDGPTAADRSCKTSSFADVARVIRALSIPSTQDKTP